VVRFLSCLLFVNQLSCQILPPALRAPSTPTSLSGCLPMCRQENPIGTVTKKVSHACFSFYEHAFHTCFLHMFLFHNVIYNLFFIFRMEYEQEVGCGEIRDAMPFAVRLERMRGREGVE